MDIDMQDFVKLQMYHPDIHSFDENVGGKRVIRYIWQNVVEYQKSSLKSDGDIELMVSRIIPYSYVNIRDGVCYIRTTQKYTDIVQKILDEINVRQIQNQPKRKHDVESGCDDGTYLRGECILWVTQECYDDIMSNDINNYSVVVTNDETLNQVYKSMFFKPISVFVYGPGKQRRVYGNGVEYLVESKYVSLIK